MKKVVVKIHSSAFNIGGTEAYATLTFEGKNLTACNTNEGLLIIRETSDEEPHEMQMAVFNKGEWIYWEKLA